MAWFVLENLSDPFQNIFPSTERIFFLVNLETTELNYKTLYDIQLKCFNLA